MQWHCGKVLKREGRGWSERKERSQSGGVARAFLIHRQSKFVSHHESKFDCSSKRGVTIVIDYLSEGEASWG